MKQAIKGNIVFAPKLGELAVLEQGYLVLDDGQLCDVTGDLKAYPDAETLDYGDALILESFADMHLHGAQYPMLGTGMDLPLLDWLNTHAFPTEAKFSDPDFARRTYRKLAKELIDKGTTRVCMFSSLHTEATWILMEELEKAGVTGYVGKVNMDRNSLPGVLEESTGESVRETLRWLAGCHFEHIQPILTARFTPSCTDKLMAELGKIAHERDLPVQSHLSENDKEIAWVKELHPDIEDYWESYDKFGLWKKGTIMAHCVHSGKRERQAMRDAGVLAVHCPDSNTNICSGVCPVRQLLEEGVQVALGSDIAGGAKLPMYQVITNTIRISQVRKMLDDLAGSIRGKENAAEDAAAGAQNDENKAAPAAARDAELTAAEGYFLGTTAGHSYFWKKEKTAASSAEVSGENVCEAGNSSFQSFIGRKLHAIVVDDSEFPEPAVPMTIEERLERALYLMNRENVIAVWSDGRKVK